LSAQQIGTKMGELVVSMDGSPSKYKTANAAYFDAIATATGATGTPTTPSVPSVPRLTAAFATPTIEYDESAYRTSKRSDTPINPVTARKAKQRSVDRICDAIDFAGTAKQQLLALTTTLQKEKYQALGVAAGVVSPREQQARVVADRCFANLKAALHHPAVKGKRTTDALTLQKTLLWSVVAPSAGPVNASPNTVRRVRSEVLETARALSLNESQGFVKQIKAATVVRRDNFSGVGKPQLID
jgi:hypothetical protein